MATRHYIEGVIDRRRLWKLLNPEERKSSGLANTAKPDQLRMMLQCFLRRATIQTKEGPVHAEAPVTRSGNIGKRVTLLLPMTSFYIFWALASLNHKFLENYTHCWYGHNDFNRLQGNNHS